MALQEDDFLIGTLAISAFQANRDFANYVKGLDLTKISYNAKDVALSHFLYPLLQHAIGEAKREEIRDEIERLQQDMGGG